MGQTTDGARSQFHINTLLKVKEPADKFRSLMEKLVHLPQNGLLRMEYDLDPVDRTSFIATEVWESKAAYDARGTGKVYKEFVLPEVVPLIVDAKVLEAVAIGEFSPTPAVATDEDNRRGPHGIPPIPFRRRGVTGNSTSLGPLIDPGKVTTNESGGTVIRGQVVSGESKMNHDGIKTEGREILEVNGILDKDGCGGVYGSFYITMIEDSKETVTWEGHWAGSLINNIGASIMIARGRGPFAGKALYLNMQEPVGLHTFPTFAPSSRIPKPGIYILDGYMWEEEYPAARPF